MNSDVLTNIPRSPGVWMQAWTRLRADRVGMVALGVTAFFVVLVVLAQLGLVAKDWQKEVGVAFAPPHFVGKSSDATQQAAVDRIEGANVDISDVDPLAPRYQEWAERAARFKSVVLEKSDTLPFGGDQLGRDVLRKVIKGAQVSITVGLAAALVATLIGTALGAVGGYFGGRLGDFLEWVYNVF
ncbi:MAG: ABC transporter permease, partial [Rhodoferax sp.]